MSDMYSLEMYMVINRSSVKEFVFDVHKGVNIIIILIRDKLYGGPNVYTKVHCLQMILFYNI